MDLHALRQQPHLSASAISTYTDCSLMFKFSYVDKLKPETTPDSLVFGTVIHKVLEQFHLHRMLGESLSILELQHAFEQHWQQKAKENETILYKEGHDYESYLALGKSLLATYVTELPQTGYEVLALEEPFKLHIPGVPVPVIGAIDLIEEDQAGTIIITDHKTAGKAYTKDEIDNNFQLTVYAMAAKANGFHDREIVLKFDCLVKTKKPKFLQYYTVRSPDEEHRVVRRIQAVWNGISKGVFIPNDTSWRCKGCSFKEPCCQWFSYSEQEDIHAPAQ